MKKSVIAVILGLAVLAGAGAYLLLVKKDEGAGHYSLYLPPDTLVTARLTHLNSLTDAFPHSALGRLLAKETMHAIMTDLKADAKSMEEYDKLHDGIVQVMTNPAFRTVFGEDTAMAVLPPDRQPLADNPAEAVRQSLVLIATTSISGALDLFSRLVTTNAVSREAVDGLELTKIILDDKQTVYGYADSTSVLLAYAPAAIKRCVTIRQAGPTLAESQPYGEAAAYWHHFPGERTYSRVFINVSPLSELLRSSEKAEAKQAGEFMQGVSHLVAATYASGLGVESRARAAYRYDQLHPQVRQAVDGAATSNQTLSLLGERSLAYSWASSLQPHTIIDSLAADPEAREAVERGIRQTLGVSLDELGRAIGPQYGFVFNEIVNGGLFPTPKMTLFLGIRDREVAARAFNGIRRQVAGYGLVAEAEEKVAGQTILSWPLLPGDAAQPAAVLTDAMFYLANGKQTLVDILTAKTAGSTLSAPVAGHLGAEVSDRVAKANFGSFVAYPERISRQTGDLFDWLAGILATTKNISIARLAQELRQFLATTEYIAVTTDLGKEYGDWALSLKSAPAHPAGHTKQ